MIAEFTNPSAEALEVTVYSLSFARKGFQELANRAS
jgi:hypothetical protein